MTSHFGLEAAVRGKSTQLVVTADSAALRRELGPLAWCALEILVLSARLDADRGLVASVGARDLARLLGVGRDAASNAVSTLRRVGLVASNDRRGSGGRFAGTELVVVLPVEESNAVTVTRRRSARAPEPTLFDLPTTHPNRLPLDHTNLRHPPTAHPPPTDTSSHSQRLRAPLPQFPHTLALRMPGGAGGASC